MDLKYAHKAIDDVNISITSYCKFLSANETGVSGSHQAGILISKSAYPIIFDAPAVKGNNIDRWVRSDVLPHLRASALRGGGFFLFRHI